MTPVFSKVYENFWAAWLKKQVIELIIPRQFGSLPKTSVVHNLVSMLDTILQHLDDPERWINLIGITLQKILTYFVIVH